jgi:hypothetical protein
VKARHSRRRGHQPHTIIATFHIERLPDETFATLELYGSRLRSAEPERHAAVRLDARIRRIADQSGRGAFRSQAGDRRSHVKEKNKWDGLDR